MNKALAQQSAVTLPSIGSNQSLITLNPAKSLDAYIHFANHVPMLTEAEELECAQRLRESNDLAAAQRLILAHLRFVIKIARGFSGYGLAMSDLIQEGNIGLMKAVKRFNPDVGVRLVTFAVHWIKAEMHEFIIKNWRIVKIATTKAQRKLFFNLRSSKKRLGWASKDEINSIAEALNVKPAEVIEMERRMNARDTAFDAPVDESDNDTAYQAPAYMLSSDHEDNPEALISEYQTEIDSTNALSDAIANLDDRARDIIQSRWLAEKKATLHDLAAKYNVSAERIRQLEQMAMQKMQGIITA